MLSKIQTITFFGSLMAAACSAQADNTQSKPLATFSLVQRNCTPGEITIKKKMLVKLSAQIAHGN